MSRIRALSTLVASCRKSNRSSCRTVSFYTSAAPRPTVRLWDVDWYTQVLQVSIEIGVTTVAFFETVTTSLPVLSAIMSTSRMPAAAICRAARVARWSQRQRLQRRLLAQRAPQR